MLTSSRVLLFVLLSFIGGIFIDSFFTLPRLLLYELLFLGVFYCLIFFKQKAIFVFGLCLLVFVLGVWRVAIAEPAEPPSLPAAESGALLSLKRTFSNIINQNLSPPHSSILSGVLFGDEKGMSKKWKDKLNITGVRHITAVSGMHIVILSNILFWLGIALGLARGKVFYFAFILLWLFILFVGFPASAIRAGIMGSMLLFAQKIGRQKSSDRALLFAGALILVQNPMLLRHSIGFQLSFLATLGIVYLMPIFQNFFQHIARKLTKLTERINPLMLNLRGLSSPMLRRMLRALLGLLAMTLAAQIFTLPILVYNFGYVSLVALFTNILIVPTLSFLMTVGFLLLIAGMIWQPLALVFLFPLWLLLAYIVKVIDFFANLSFSSVAFHIHWLWLFIFYAVLTILLWHIKKRQKLKLLP